MTSTTKKNESSPFNEQRTSSDTINASLVKVEAANRQYILTQSPLMATVANFWLMVWENKSRAIVMLNKIVENKQVMSHWYWPAAPGLEHKMVLTNVGLTLEYLERKYYSYYSTRIFRLTDIKSGESKQIYQFQYTAWPDCGVPRSPDAMLEFLKVVRNSGSLESSVGPAVIHCTSGIDRSGIFCLVDTCLVLTEKEGLNSVNVKDILLEMRKYRMGLIQTPDQLRFSYQAIIEGAKLFSLLNYVPFDEDVKTGALSRPLSTASSEVDEPPQLPPSRGRSHTRSYMTVSPPINRKLPKIPKSASLNYFPFDEDVKTGAPSRPLPTVPSNKGISSSEDELLPETNSVSSVRSTPFPSSEDRDTKKSQHEADQWSQLKRTLYKPVVIGMGMGLLLLGGGALAYAHFRA